MVCDDWRPESIMPIYRSLMGAVKGPAPLGIRAIFGYGNSGTVTAITNLVSSSGVVSADTTGVGQVRFDLAAAPYGTDKGIFGYGYTPSYSSITNLVSNAGVVATDTTGVGTARRYLAATSYGS